VRESEYAPFAVVLTELVLDAPPTVADLIVDLAVKPGPPENVSE